MQLIANLSLLFTERPLEQRFAAAAASGFDGVEIQFPYGEPVGPLAAAANAAGMPVVLINMPAGDPAKGDIALATDLARDAAFRAAVAECRRYAAALDVRKVNILAGPPPPGQSAAATEACLLGRVQLAADALAADGRTTVVEVVNSRTVPGYWLDRIDRGLRFLSRLEHPAVGLQLDLFHVAMMEADPYRAILSACDSGRIRHVQFADCPGRHEPGTGTINFERALGLLASAGYDDAVSAEYLPAAKTADGLDWIGRFRRLPGLSPPAQRADRGRAG